jgi:hypothetical protein
MLYLDLYGQRVDQAGNNQPLASADILLGLLSDPENSGDTLN